MWLHWAGYVYDSPPQAESLKLARDSKGTTDSSEHTWFYGDDSLVWSFVGMVVDLMSWSPVGGLFITPFLEIGVWAYPLSILPVRQLSHKLLAVIEVLNHPLKQLKWAVGQDARCYTQRAGDTPRHAISMTSQTQSEDWGRVIFHEWKSQAGVSSEREEYYRPNSSRVVTQGYQWERGWVAASGKGLVTSLGGVKVIIHETHTKSY